MADSERDWVKVTTDLNKFIEDAMERYNDSQLLAADMIEVNGYIVSMRVVITPLNPPSSEMMHILEHNGSSSHVSISSAFSSF